MGKVIYRPFCFEVQQEMLQVSKDMMTTAMLEGLIFPAMFMKEKKNPKPTPTYLSFFLNIQTGSNIDILFINLIVTKTVHYKQYRNKLKGMCHTSWLIFYMQFKNTAYSLIVHSYCVDRVHHQLSGHDRRVLVFLSAEDKSQFCSVKLSSIRQGHDAFLVCRKVVNV